MHSNNNFDKTKPEETPETSDTDDLEQKDIFQHTAWIIGACKEELKFINFSLKLPFEGKLEILRNHLKKFVLISQENHRRARELQVYWLNDLLGENPETKEVGSSPIKFTKNKKIQTMATNNKIFHPQKFSGLDNDLKKFLDNFELCSKANGWEDKDQAKYLPMYLTDLALNIFNNIPESDKKDKTWKDLKPIFLKYFNQSAQKDMCESKLMTRVQKEGETILQYITDILDLCSSIDENMAEKDKCKHILKGLLPEIHAAVSLCDNTTFQNLRENLQKYECSKNLIDYRKNQDKDSRLKKVEHEIFQLSENLSKGLKLTPHKTNFITQGNQKFNPGFKPTFNIGRNPNFFNQQNSGRYQGPRPNYQNTRPMFQSNYQNTRPMFQPNYQSNRPIFQRPYVQGSRPNFQNARPMFPKFQSGYNGQDFQRNKNVQFQNQTNNTRFSKPGSKDQNQRQFCTNCKTNTHDTSKCFKIDKKKRQN